MRSEVRVDADCGHRPRTSAKPRRPGRASAAARISRCSASRCGPALQRAPWKPGRVPRRLHARADQAD